MVKFKMKKKPKQPVRRCGEFNAIDISDLFYGKEFTLSELINKIKETKSNMKTRQYGIPYESELDIAAFDHFLNLKFEFVDTSDYYDSSSRYCLYLKVPYMEKESAFNKRMDKYEKDLAAYEQWLKDNKENIVEYERAQALKNEEKKRKAEEKKQRNTARKKEQLEKQLKQLTKQLEKL